MMGPQSITYLQSYFPAHTNMLGSLLIPFFPFLLSASCPRPFFFFFFLHHILSPFPFLFPHLSFGKGDSPYLTSFHFPFPICRLYRKIIFCPFNFLQLIVPFSFTLKLLKNKRLQLSFFTHSLFNLLSSDPLLLRVKLVDFSALFSLVALTFLIPTSLKFSLPFFCV